MLFIRPCRKIHSLYALAFLCAFSQKAALATNSATAIAAAMAQLQQSIANTVQQAAQTAPTSTGASTQGTESLVLARLGATVGNKNSITSGSDIKQSFVDAISANPILEVLSAWIGVVDEQDWTPGAWQDVTNIVRTKIFLPAIGCILCAGHENYAGTLTIAGKAAPSAGLWTDIAPGKKKSLGIIYRDTTGVHYRQFYFGQGIALPAPTRQDSDTNKRNQRCYFYANQLEEIDRGLLTFEARGKWELCIALVNSLAFSGFFPPTNGYSQGEHFVEAGASEPQNWQLFLALGTIGRNGEGSHMWLNNALTANYSHAVTTATPNYNVLPDIDDGPAKLSYMPYSNKTQPFWFAYDRGFLRLGEGSPTNEDELKNTLVEYTPSAGTKIAQWMRHFMLAGPIAYSNIKSLPLNPKKKFCTPPYCKGTFYFWRPEWQIATPDRFSLTFKARGRDVMVALHTKNPLGTGAAASNIAGTTIPYTLVASSGKTTILKNKVQVFSTNDTATAPNTVTARRGTGGEDLEQYYPYWITYDTGIFTFGSGAEPTKNPTCSYKDPSPIPGIVALSFSSNDEPTDYIDIVLSSYATAYKFDAKRGLFDFNAQAFTMEAADQTSLTFKARTTSTTGTDKTIRIGFNDSQPTTPAGAQYSIALGAEGNTVCQILKNGSVVASERKSIPTGTDFTDFWVVYDNASISYGTGTIIGQNAIGTWKDRTPDTSKKIKYIAFSSDSNVVEVSTVTLTKIDAQGAYTVSPAGQGVYRSWQAQWLLDDENRGGLSCVASVQAGTPDKIVQIGLASPAKAAGGQSDYDIIIGKKVGDKYKLVIQVQGKDKASVDLSAAQLPTPTGTPYWVVVYDERIIIGMGTDAGNPDQVLLKYSRESSDTQPLAPLRHFSFTSSGSIATYKDISTLEFAAIQAFVDTADTAAQSEDSLVKQWQTTPAQQSIPVDFAKRLYWLSNRQLPTPDKGSLSLTLKAATAPIDNGATFCIALNATGGALDATSGAVLFAKSAYAGAQYVLELKPSSGTVSLNQVTATGALAPLATSAAIPVLNTLFDGADHKLWLNYESGSISLGVDTNLGISPVWQTKITTPTTGMRYLAFTSGGTAPMPLTISGITTKTLYDPSKYLTPIDFSYAWNADWLFTARNSGSVSFNLQPVGAQCTIVAIGFGPSTVPTNTTAPYAGATYNLMFYSNGRVGVSKKGAATTLLGRTNSTQIAQLLSDGKKHAWWAAYSDGTLLLGAETAVGVNPLWSWTDPSPDIDIQTVSFTSYQYAMQVSGISFNAGTTIAAPMSQTLGGFEDVLIKEPSKLAASLDAMVSSGAYKQDPTTFVKTLSLVCRARELLSADVKTAIGQIVTDTLGDQSLAAANRQLLQDGNNLLASTPSLEELIAQYKKDISSLQIFAQPLDSPVRRLFIYKLSRITDATITPSDLLTPLLDGLAADGSDALGSLVKAIHPALVAVDQTPFTQATTFSPAEKTALTALALRLNTERKKLFSQTTAARLQNIGTLIDPGQQILAIRNLAEAKRNDTTNQIVFRPEDTATLLDLARSLVENRDQLLSTELADLQRALTSLSSLAHIKADTAHKTAVQTMITTAQKELSLDDRLAAAKGRLAAIESQPSTAPARQLFFKTLSRVLDGTGAKSAQQLDKITAEIVTPLQAYALSDDETKQVQDVVARITKVRTTVNQVDSRIADAKATCETAFGFCQALIGILNDKDTSVTFKNTDYLLFVDALYSVVMNRDLFDDSQLPAVQLLLQRTQFSQGFNPTASYSLASRGVQITLSQLVDKLTEPYEFGQRIDFAIQETQNIIASTDPLLPSQIKCMLSRLSKIKNAPGDKTSDLFAKLNSQVFMPLIANTKISEADRATLTTLYNEITAQKASLIAAQATFRFNYDQAQAKAANLSPYLKELKRIFTALQAKKITYADADIDTIRTELGRLINIRDEFSPLDRDTLTQIIQLIGYSPLKTGITNTAALLDQLSPANDITFADRVAKYRQEVLNVPTLRVDDPDEGPLRVRFFNKLANLANAPGDKTVELLQSLQNDIIAPLEKAPLQPQESELVAKMKAAVATATSIVNSVKSRIETGFTNAGTLFAFAQVLDAILKDNGTALTFGPDDYGLFVNSLHYVVKNRELLVDAQIALVQMLLQKVQFTSGFDAKKAYPLTIGMPATTLEALTNELTEPYVFTDRLAYAALLTQEVIARRTAISDNKTKVLAAKLAIIKDAPGTKTNALFEQLNKQVILFLISSNAIVKADQDAISKIYEDITKTKDILIKQQATFSYNYTQAQTLAGNMSSYLKELKRIFTGVQSKAITYVDTDIDVIRGELNRLIDIRDEFDDNDKNNLRQSLRLLKYSTLAKVLPELTDLDTKLNPENDISFVQRVAKYKGEIQSVLYLSADNPEESQLRARFFAKLSKLSSAAATVTSEQLQDFQASLLKPLADAPLAEQEAAIIAKLQAFVTSTTQNMSTPKFRIAAADTSAADFYSYAQILDGALRMQTAETPFGTEDYSLITNSLSYLAANREVFSSDQRIFITAMFDFILTSFLDSDGNLIDPKQVPEMYNTGFGPFAQKLFTLKTQLSTSMTMKERTDYAIRELNDFVQRAVPATHCRVKRYLSKVALIIDAPGLKAAADFDSLKNMLYQPLLTYLQKNGGDIANVTQWLAELPAKKADTLSKQSDFTFHLAIAQKIQTESGSGPYIVQLQNIILGKRNGEIIFKDADYATFMSELTLLVTNRDGLALVDWLNLQKVVATTCNTKGFQDNDQYKTKLAALYQDVQNLPDFNTQIKLYTTQLPLVLSAPKGGAERVLYFKKLSNVTQLPGFKDPVMIEQLATNIQKLQEIILTPEEQAILTKLSTDMAQAKTKTGTVEYALSKINNDMTAARTAGDGSYLMVFVNGLQSILQKKNDGSLLFNDNDPQRILKAADVLVQNRETLSADQITQAQTAVGDYQYVEGFEALVDSITTLVQTLGTPLTFAQRLAKYQQKFSQVSQLPNDTPANVAIKSEYLTSLAALMDAPGDRDTATLDQLATLLKRISVGSFSADQKALIAPMQDKINTQRQSLNSFSFRFSAMSSGSPTVSAYLSGIEKIVDDISRAAITITAPERTALLASLSTEVDLRPLTADTGSQIFVLIDKVKITPGFAEDTAQQATLIKLAETLKTDAGFDNRITYFSSTLPTIMRADATSSERKRFFDRLQNFIDQVTMLSSPQLSTLSATTLDNAIALFSRYQSSATVTEGERGIFATLIKQLSTTKDKIARAVIDQQNAATAAAAATAADAQKALARNQAVANAPVKTNLVGGDRFMASRVNRRGPVAI